MHFKPSHSDEETRPAELFVFIVLAQNVADVLAKKALNALAEFLHPINVFLLHSPIGPSLWSERGNFLVDLVIPRNVCDQVFDDRERLHRQNGDGLVLGKGIHAGFASESRSPVDFRRTRAALAGLAIPADSEVWSQVLLNVMKCVEHDHARRHWNPVISGLAAFAIAAEDF